MPSNSEREAPHNINLSLLRFIHFLDHILFLEAVHELQRRRCSFGSVRFINVDLEDHSGTRHQTITIRAYHWSIKLVHFLPPLLPRPHDINLLILQRPRLVHILHHSLCGITKPTWTTSKEGDATFEKTGCGTEHDFEVQHSTIVVCSMAGCFAIGQGE